MILTDTLSSKFTIKRSLNMPQNLATLAMPPCKI